MNSGGARLVAGVIAVGALAGLGALSQLSYPSRVPEQSVIRLTWRVRSHRQEACRRLTPEELAALPPHMRREEVCEGRLLPYHLRVVLDGRTILEEEVRPAGVRADRPLYVYHEIPVAPGEQRLEVEFVREDVLRAGTRGGDQRPTGTIESEAERGRESPAVLRFERRLMLAAGQVTLLTYDAEGGQLVAWGYGVVR